MFIFDVDERGYLKKRESSDLEYKENFHRGDEMLKYIKTLVGMANKKGGSIVFGVKDSPHIPIGMTNTKFIELDTKDLDNLIRQYTGQTPKFFRPPYIFSPSCIPENMKVHIWQPFVHESLCRR